MPGVWSFLRSRRNQQVIGWLAGGAATLAAATWTAFVYFDGKARSTAAPPPTVSATPTPAPTPVATAAPSPTVAPLPTTAAPAITADHGGVAIGGSATNTSIETNASRR